MPLIYIFDHDADITFVLTTWLENNGYKTKGFSTHGELIASFKYGMPDCIILDNLYGGLAATKHICDVIQNVFHFKGKILLSTTGRVTNEEWENCDAIDFIPKPFDLDQVLDTVNRVLENSLA